MLDKTLREILGSRRTCTVGHFTLGQYRIAFGLSRSDLLGVKPSYDKETGTGGGFDPDRWRLRDLLKHELGKAMDREALLTLLDGTKLRRADIAAFAFSWEVDPPKKERPK